MKNKNENVKKRNLHVFMCTSDIHLSGPFLSLSFKVFLMCSRLLQKTFILTTHQDIKLCKKKKPDSSRWLFMHEKDPILSNVHIFLKART